MRHPEIDVLGYRIDETAAFSRHAFIHHAQTQIANLGVQGISEYDQHDCWRKQELDKQDTIAPELLDFFRGQREIASYERGHWPPLPFELHLAHLNHIQSEERKRQYDQCHYRPK